MQASELKSLADAPSTAREYETIYIVRPNSTNENVSEINERVRKVIESMDGKIIKVDNWGKRRLAYEVAKERKGIYLYWLYLAGHGVVQELERNLRMLDSVIRYMTIKRDADIDPNARPTEVDDETYELAASTAADEEDMYLTHKEGEEGEEGEGEAKAEGDAKAAEGDAKAAEGDAKAAEGDAKAAEGDAKAAEGDAKAAEGDAKAAEGDAEAEGDAKAAEGDAKAAEGDAKAAEASAAPATDAKAQEGEE